MMGLFVVTSLVTVWDMPLRAISVSYAMSMTRSITSVSPFVAMDLLALLQRTAGGPLALLVPHGS